MFSGRFKAAWSYATPMHIFLSRKGFGRLSDDYTLFRVMEFSRVRFSAYGEQE